VFQRVPRSPEAPHGWTEGPSGNGPGWTATEDSDPASGDDRRGVVTLWPVQPEAPDVVAVTVRYGHSTYRVPTVDGWWLFAAFQQVAPAHDWPIVSAVHRVPHDSAP
jgi:hypothetical protein